MRFIQFILLAVFLYCNHSYAQKIGSALAVTAATEQPKFADSVLWRVTGNGLNQPSYVFGSWHFLCRNEIIFKNKVKLAISQTEQLLIQNFITYLSSGDYFIDQSESAMIDRGVEIYKIDDRKIRKKLLKLIRKHLDLKVDHAKRVMPVLKRMTPFEVFFSSMHSFINDCNRLGSFDQLLFNHFNNQNNKVGSVNDRKAFEESLMVSGFVSPNSLISYIEDIESQKALVTEMKSSYYVDESLADLRKLYRIFLTNDHTDIKSVNRYIFELDVKPWVQVMTDWMHEKPTFISINATYLIGEHGVLSALASQGYLVEPVLD